MEENSATNTPYIPPCRRLLKERVVCPECGKRVTLHTRLYRHKCQPYAERLQAIQASLEQKPPEAKRVRSMADLPGKPHDSRHAQIIEELRRNMIRHRPR